MAIRKEAQFVIAVMSLTMGNMSMMMKKNLKTTTMTRSTQRVSWPNRKRVHRRAVERQDKGYPSSMRRRVVSVTDAEWVSQFDAAEHLHISMWAVGSYISTGRLTPAENPAGQAGVTAVSVEAEAEWRRGSRLYGRFWRRVKEQLRII